MKHTTSQNHLIEKLKKENIKLKTDLEEQKKLCYYWMRCSDAGMTLINANTAKILELKKEIENISTRSILHFQN